MAKLKRSRINYTRLDPALDEWLQIHADNTGQSKSYLLYQAARRFRDQIIREEKTETIRADMGLLPYVINPAPPVEHIER